MQRIYTRVPAVAFHYTTDYAASFSLTSEIFVCFLLVQKNQAVTLPLFRIWNWSLHRNQLFEKILHVNKLPSQEGFIEDFV